MAHSSRRHAARARGSSRSRRASPTRFSASTITKIARPGQQHHVGTEDHELAARGEHAAPVRRRRLGAEAEEAQSRRREDLRADVEAERDDERREQVRDHVARAGSEDRGCRGRARPRRTRARGPTARRRARGACRAGKPTMAMAIMALRRPGSQPGDDGDGEQDVGKGHQDVGEAHDHRLRPAAVVAGHEPERDADHHGGARPRRRRRAARRARPRRADSADRGRTRRCRGDGRRVSGGRRRFGVSTVSGSASGR